MQSSFKPFSFFYNFYFSSIFRYIDALKNNKVKIKWLTGDMEHLVEYK